jgi:hypothetical protein
MSDGGFLQQMLQGLQGSGVPTPFGWVPLQRAQAMGDNLMTRDNVANTLGAPVDALAWLWRQGDMNPPDIQRRLYSQPPALGSEWMRNVISPADSTPSRATITPGGTPPAPSIFDQAQGQSWPSALAVALYGRPR